MSNQAITKVGIIGCGNISGIYLENARRFKNIEVVAVADLLVDRAKAKAEEFGISKALTVDQILTDPDVEIVVNLTIPDTHAAIAIAALDSGKHVYGEKPLAVTLEQGRKIIELAMAKGLRVGSAPDTFFGASHQTCRRLIDEGQIGEPVAATGFMLGHGPEKWHPDPSFFYKGGGGPLLDMGPYYITALINMIGGVRRVSSSARASLSERVIGSGPKKGELIVVETPTHISATLDFENGAIATLVTSFDVWHQSHSNIEVYGTEGSILVPDPNGFGGVVKLRRADDPAWIEVPPEHGFENNSRGVGLADLAAAIKENRPHRASGALAFHVLDIMLSTLESSLLATHIELSSAVGRPAALPKGLADDVVD